MKELLRMQIEDMSQAGEARRLAASFCKLMDFSSTEAGNVALIITEMTKNIVKHANGGEVLIRVLENGQVKGMEILTIDNGPGIANITQSIRDGFSTAGSQGTGLGAIIRLSSFFDVYSEQGKGTVIMSRFWAGSIKGGWPSRPLDIGALCLPMKGEEICGDGWAVEQTSRKSLIFVSDGIGHGSDASEASLTAADIFRKNKAKGPHAIVEAVHAGLRSTRGAAIAVAEADHINKVVRYSGIGNISGRIISGEIEKNMVSHNGTAGHDIRKIQEFSYPWDESNFLIMHSDGLATHWKLGDYPNIMNRHPSVISAVLYRDHFRGRDDVTVVIARKTRAQNYK